MFSSCQIVLLLQYEAAIPIQMRHMEFHLSCSQLWQITLIVWIIHKAHNSLYEKSSQLAVIIQSNGDTVSENMLLLKQNVILFIFMVLEYRCVLAFWHSLNLQLLAGFTGAEVFLATPLVQQHFSFVPLLLTCFWNTMFRIFHPPFADKCYSEKLSKTTRYYNMEFYYCPLFFPGLFLIISRVLPRSFFLSLTLFRKHTHIHTHY